MAKQLPTGRLDVAWKQLPSGLFVPGLRLLPTGRELSAAQQMVRDVYVAGGQKPLELVTVADIGIEQATAAGRVSRWGDYSGRNRDWTQATAASQPAYTASEPSIGGRGMVVTQGTRWMFNAWNPPAPGTLPAYVKSVLAFLSWPPGGRQGTAAAVNRYAWRTTAPQRANIVNSATPSGDVDLPLGPWGVLTWRMTNSVADSIRFGSALNVSSGINVGNVDPASLGKFASNTGTTGITMAEACEFRWSVALTAAEDEAVEDVLDAYYGGALLKYDSVGNIKPVLDTWFGDSITRHDASYGYEGFRFSFFDQFYTTDGYYTYATGVSANGTWAQPAHTGVSGLGINIDSGGPNPGAALALLNQNYGSGAATPVSGAGTVGFFHLMIGTNDCNGGVYVPVVTATDYQTLCQRALDIEPEDVLCLTTIPPQLGDPANVAAFNGELPAVWAALAAANPTRTIVTYDAFAAMGGAYNAALYLDALHPNLAGQQLIGAALVAAVAAAMNTKTTY